MVDIVVVVVVVVVGSRGATVSLVMQRVRTRDAPHSKWETRSAWRKGVVNTTRSFLFSDHFFQIHSLSLSLRDKRFQLQT